jgi:DNA-binding NtrC family response regulator
VQRSILIFSLDGDLIEKCEQELHRLGFFTLFAQAELPARKILHDIPIALVLFDAAPEWQPALKTLNRIQGSHSSVPFILMFDPEPSPPRELAMLGQVVTGFYNKKAPFKELTLEVTRLFPDLRHKVYSQK